MESFLSTNRERSSTGEQGVTFLNQPKLSDNPSDQTFNERRQLIVPQLPELIRRSSLFHDQPVSAEFFHTGVSSIVCKVTAGTERYVLKVPLSLTDGNGEAMFLKTWEQAGVRVPHVFEDGQLGDHPYVLMEYIEAPSLQQNITNETAKESAWNEMGGTLAQMHTPVTQGFGRLVNGEPQYARFEDWLSGPDVAKYLQRVKDNNLLDDRHGSIEDTFRVLREYSSGREASTLCHFDFTPNNILATEPLTVFDPSPMFNYGVIDLGRTMLSSLFHDKPEQIQQLEEGYMATGAEYDRRAVHAALILNAYWKFPFQHRQGRTKEMDNVRKYLEEHASVVQ